MPTNKLRKKISNHETKELKKDKENKGLLNHLKMPKILNKKSPKVIANKRGSQKLI